VRAYGSREQKVMTMDEVLAMFAELNEVPKKVAKV
jgi:hypothetical protein